jgi:hypothetical protein
MFLNFSPKHFSANTPSKSGKDLWGFKPTVISSGPKHAADFMFKHANLPSFEKKGISGGAFYKSFHVRESKYMAPAEWVLGGEFTDGELALQNLKEENGIVSKLAVLQKQNTSGDTIENLVEAVHTADDIYDRGMAHVERLYKANKNSADLFEAANADEDYLKRRDDLVKERMEGRNKKRTPPVVVNPVSEILRKVAEKEAKAAKQAKKEKQDYLDRSSKLNPNIDDHKKRNEKYEAESRKHRFEQFDEHRNHPQGANAMDQDWDEIPEPTSHKPRHHHHKQNVPAENADMDQGEEEIPEPAADGSRAKQQPRRPYHEDVREPFKEVNKILKRYTNKTAEILYADLEIINDIFNEAGMVSKASKKNTIQEFMRKQSAKAYTDDDDL